MPLLFISSAYLFLQAGHPRCDDPTLRKIQDLLKLGTPVPVLAEALELISHCPWSILRNEQMHGASAKQHHIHRNFVAETHAAKSAVSMLGAMTNAAMPTHRQTAQQVRLHSLKRKRPEKATTQGTYLGVASSRALEALPAEARPLDRRETCRKVLKKHHSEFKKLPAEVQQKYARKNKADKQRKANEIRAEVNILEDKIREKEAKKLEKLNKSSPLRSSLFGWSAEDLHTVTAMFYGPDFTESVVDNMCGQDTNYNLKRKSSGISEAFF